MGGNKKKNKKKFLCGFFYLNTLTSKSISPPMVAITINGKAVIEGSSF